MAIRRRYIIAFLETCPTCGGSGKRSTARSARGRELERHEKYGTPCGNCGGSGASIYCYWDGNGNAATPEKAALIASKGNAALIARRFRNAVALPYPK